MSGSEHARPAWLDEDWFDVIAEALIRTGRPGLAEKFREKWWASPADPAEAVLDVFNTTGVEPKPLSRFTSQDVADAVLRALGCAKDPA